MYFIVNNDGYIVASSRDFLESIGYRDMCSISLALKNKQFSLDSDSKEIQISDNTYLYNSSDMYSTLGDLKLYSLTKKSNLVIEEDENIAYLKKIKEGVVTREDSNFDIPVIKRDDIEEVTVTKPTIAIPEVKEEILEHTEETETKVVNLVDAAKKELNEELVDISIKADEEIKDIDEKIETKAEESIEDAKDKLKDIEEKIELEKEKVEEKLTEALEDVKEKAKDIKESIEAEKEKIKSAVKDDIEERLHKKEEIVEEALIETKKEKKSALEKIKSKLFPWGSTHKDEKIELEDEPSNTIKSASELIDEDIEAAKEEVKHSSEEITVEDLVKQELEDDAKELESIKEDIKESETNIKIETDNIKENLETEHSMKLFEHEQEPQVTNDNIDIEALLNSTTTQEENFVTKEPKSNLTLEEEELLVLKDIIKEEEPTNTNTNLKQEIVKETITKVEEEPTTIIKEEVKELKVEPKETTTVSSANEELLHKLVSLQVESINIEENAKKLSIDVDNYKLLLNNYLDELDNYKTDIANGSSSTINILTDASQLLSLDAITNKLEKLSNNSDNKNKITELELIKSLLRDKLAKNKSKETKNSIDKVITQEVIEKSVIAKTTKKETLLEPKVVENKIKEESTSIPAIPQEVVEITNPAELLSKINFAKINYDPAKAASELNLPKTLILEFVNDFISQAKDHLGQLIDAYKTSDIKTLQTTAHMLKGAASNLRLDPIAETLFKIQKESSINQSGEHLKNFVAQLKGLEHEVENLEKEDNED